MVRKEPRGAFSIHIVFFSAGFAGSQGGHFGFSGRPNRGFRREARSAPQAPKNETGRANRRRRRRKRRPRGQIGAAGAKKGGQIEKRRRRVKFRHCMVVSSSFFELQIHQNQRKITQKSNKKAIFSPAAPGTKKHEKKSLIRKFCGPNSPPLGGENFLGL